MVKKMFLKMDILKSIYMYFQKTMCTFDVRGKKTAIPDFKRFNKRLETFTNFTEIFSIYLLIYKFYIESFFLFSKVLWKYFFF